MIESERFYRKFHGRDKRDKTNPIDEEQLPETSRVNSSFLLDNRTNMKIIISVSFFHDRVEHRYARIACDFCVIISFKLNKWTGTFSHTIFEGFFCTFELPCLKKITEYTLVVELFYKKSNFVFLLHSQTVSLGACSLFGRVNSTR